MPEATYENLRPMLAKEELTGSTMRCTFKCPVSEFSIEASATVQQKKSAVGQAAGTVARSAKASMMWQLRSAVAGAVGRLLGGGIASQVGRQAAYSATTGMTRTGGGQASYSDAEKQAAVVAAFGQVASKFMWDAENSRWISTKAGGETVTDFARQLEQAPVAAPYDVGVLARMLTEIANADGQISDDEKGFLAGFIPPLVGSVDSMLAKPALSSVELEETASGPSRETMLMLAWAVALTDEDLAAEELARIEAHAQGLGIAATRAAELKQYAQMFVVSQAIEAAYSGGEPDAATRQHITDLATGIGLAPEEAQRAEIRYRKRMGIV